MSSTTSNSRGAVGCRPAFPIITHHESHHMDPYHHSLSSVKKWGGEVADYLAVHAWFDFSKGILADFRHRALRHHAEGIALCVQVFGATLTLSNGKVIPTRWVGEQHVREDLGHIPSFADWARAICPEPWMGKVAMKSVELGQTSSRRHPISFGAAEEGAMSDERAVNASSGKSRDDGGERHAPREHMSSD